MHNAAPMQAAASCARQQELTRMTSARSLVLCMLNPPRRAAFLLLSNELMLSQHW
jgi:hypothetical protein